MNLENKHRGATARPTGTQQFHLCGKHPARERQHEARPQAGFLPGLFPHPGVTALQQHGPSSHRTQAQRTQISGQQPLDLLQDFLPVRFQPAGPGSPSKSFSNVGPWPPTRPTYSESRVVPESACQQCLCNFYLLKWRHNCSRSPGSSSESDSELLPLVLNRESWTPPRGYQQPTSAVSPHSSGHAQGGDHYLQRGGNTLRESAELRIPASRQARASFAKPGLWVG